MIILASIFSCNTITYIPAVMVSFLYDKFLCFIGLFLEKVRHIDMYNL